MAFAVPIMMIAGAALTAVSAIQQGQAAKEAANYNAKIAEQNAVIARESAQRQADQVTREKTMRLGAMRAAVAANGGTIEGSALDVIGDTAAQFELQRQEVLYQGELSARGYSNTAALDRFSGANAEKKGYMNAAGSLLSSAGSAYGSFSRMG